MFGIIFSGGLKKSTFEASHILGYAAIKKNTQSTQHEKKQDIIQEKNSFTQDK